MKTSIKTERGQALILIVFALLGLIGITALAVDGGMAYADRRQAQTAADSAVLAAALARVRGENYRSAALSNARENGYNSDGVDNLVEVHVPPVSGPYRGNQEYLQVIVTSHQPTYFAGVLGFDTITNTVEAIARAKPAEWAEIMHGYAVISLAPTSDCNRFRSFWIHGESTLELYGGGIFVNSNNRTCAFIQQGSAGLVFGEPEPFNIVGGASIQKLQMIKLLVGRPIPAMGGQQRGGDNQGDQQRGDDNQGRQASIAFLPNTGDTPVPYPPPFAMPKVGCGARVAGPTLEDPTIMNSGNWDGDFPPPDIKTLRSGVYCINGNVRVNGGTDLEGHGVVLVVEHGSVHFNGGANIILEAPNSGPLKGLLLYMPMDNHDVLVLNGSASSVFRGTILAPGARIRIIGNESSYGFHSQIIGYYIELDGNSNIVIRYVDDQNYDALISPEIQFGQ